MHGHEQPWCMDMSGCSAQELGGAVHGHEWVACMTIGMMSRAARHGHGGAMRHGHDWGVEARQGQGGAGLPTRGLALALTCYILLPARGLALL